jgi:hypothetical protein
MYGIVLAIIKVVSEGVTVGFGIWGLFPEPEAEQAEIIRHRRIAATITVCLVPPGRRNQRRWIPHIPR